uniref:GAGE domain-containing protein n=1 Tax=Moschus moschiferus TaxID=68415 RepID=A0A8C6E3C6_MOSMO
MSRRMKSTYRPKGRGFGQYPKALVSVEEPEEEPPTERKNITPGQEGGQEREDEGASALPGPAQEAVQQELAEPKTGEHEDGPDVKEKGLPNPEPMKMPEAGMLSY